MTQYWPVVAMRGVSASWQAFANFEQWMTYMQVLSRHVLDARGIDVGIRNPAKGTVGISVGLGSRAVVASLQYRDVKFGATISISSQPRPVQEGIGSLGQGIETNLDVIMNSLRSITSLPQAADKLGAQLS